MKFLKINLLALTCTSVLLLYSCTSSTNSNQSGSENFDSDVKTENSNLSETNSSSKEESNAQQSRNIPGAANTEAESPAENGLFQNSENNQPKSINSIEELRSQLENQSQGFVKNTDQEISIQGKMGTRIFIPERSLVRKNGTIATGKINIELVECYDHLSFFTHQLSTHTTESDLLETGGMINIIATQNGDTLSLLPEKQMIVMFPKKGTSKEKMLPFLGVKNNDGNMEWKVDSKSVQAPATTTEFSMGQPRPSKQSEFEEIPSEHYLEVGEMAPELGENFKWNFKDSIGSLENWLPKQLIKSEILQNSILTTGSNVLVHLSFSSSGTLQTVTSTRLIGQELLDALYVFLRKAPTPDLSEITEGKKYPLMLKGKVIRDTRSYNEKFEKKYNDNTRGYIAKIPEAELNYYIMNVSGLGWINCDRFYRDNRPKVNYAIRGEDGTNVSLVFTKIKSQIQGVIRNGVFIVPNLPAGEPVRIVAVKRTEEEISVGVSNSMINSNGDESPKTKEATLEEYRNAFAIQ